VHFGAGRLGLGLVVPAIAASGVPFTVLQRKKVTWTAVSESAGGYMDVIINGDIVVPNLEKLDSANVPDELPPRSFMCVSDPKEMGPVTQRATSFSCSLGSAMRKVLAPVLKELPLVDPEHQPVLYACENDHDLVMKLQKDLAGRVLVVDCMVDRVCMGRAIEADGNSITVEAEPWKGSIVALAPGLKQRVPFCKSVATVPQSKEEAEYYSFRKFSLVNGMHTVVAFTTLVKKYDPNLVQEYLLIKYINMRPRSQEAIRAWSVARVGEIIEKFGMSSIMEWHGLNSEEEAFDMLIDFSLDILVNRFSQTQDVVSRVLGGGVSNRWLTRLCPVQDYLIRREKLQTLKNKKKQAALGSIATKAKVISVQGNRGVRKMAPSQQQNQAQSGDEEVVDIASAVALRVKEAEDSAIATAATAATTAAAATDCRDVVQRLFVHAGFGSTGPEAEAKILGIVSELVDNARPFCTTEQRITNTELIKMQKKYGGRKNSPLVIKAAEEEEEKAAAKAAEEAKAKAMEYVAEVEEVAEQSEGVRDSEALEELCDLPIGVLLDFDGTLGDTEAPTAHLAWLELAPFFPQRPIPERVAFTKTKYAGARGDFVRLMAGVDAQRIEAGLAPIEKVREACAASPRRWDVELADSLFDRDAIDKQRRIFGLPKLALASPNYASLYDMQQQETLKALSVSAERTPRCREMLRSLLLMGVCGDESSLVRLAIATSAGKPRVERLLDATGLRAFFEDEGIFSAQADPTSLVAPKLAPDPAIYRNAADWVGVDAERCIAVEDSLSGVASAADAGIGVVVGYIGGSHIPDEIEEKAQYAKRLLKGDPNSVSQRGANVVINDIRDLPKIVEIFIELNRWKTATSVDWNTPEKSKLLAKTCKGKVWSSPK